MEIDILIDKITDCLIDRKSGIIVNTRYEMRKEKFTSKENKNWRFNWNKPYELGYHVYELFISNSDIVQGRIALKIDGGVADVNIVETAPHNFGSSGQYIGVGAHLFAIACLESYNAGCDGYVAFDSKSNLMSYYSKELGAKSLFGIRMVIEEKEAALLISKYFESR